jgi:putative protease
MKRFDFNNLELLAPAGSPEKLKYALHYGADAVYAGIPDFSLRSRINAFDFKELKKGSQLAHELGKKFYVTLNIYAHNQHFEKLEEHLKELKKIDIDGIILSDPGVLMLVKECLPKVEIHLSTQANAINWRAVKFWGEQGIKRVVLAREVTLEEIKEIHEKVPNMELEYFVHGAMCMSYSGRCMLSKWMSKKSANLGDCSQPCRWGYHETRNMEHVTKEAIVKDNRGEFEIDVEEDSQGTYFFNSKDLNLLNYLADLIDAGITSFKIEGRNKSVYYLALVLRAYRNALDALAKGEDVSQAEQENLDSLVHRGYTEGFLLGKEPEHNFENSHNESEYEFVGEIVKVKSEKLKVESLSVVEVRVHNAICAGDELEIVDKKGNHAVETGKIHNDKMEKVDSAHGGHGKNYFFEFDKKNIEPLALIRKKNRIIKKYKI